MQARGLELMRHSKQSSLNRSHCPVQPLSSAWPQSYRTAVSCFFQLSRPEQSSHATELKSKELKKTSQVMWPLGGSLWASREVLWALVPALIWTLCNWQVFLSLLEVSVFVGKEEEHTKHSLSTEQHTSYCLLSFLNDQDPFDHLLNGHRPPYWGDKGN